MKKFFLIITLFGGFLGANAQEDDAIKLISPIEFESCVDHEDVQLIDVRTAGEFKNGSIHKAINLDFYKKKELINGFEELDKKKPVYVFCQAGGRSKQAAQILRDMGFNEIYDLKGGYSNYPKKSLK